MDAVHSEVIFIRSDSATHPKEKTKNMLAAHGMAGMNLPLIKIIVDYDALNDKENRQALLNPDWLLFQSAKAGQILLSQYLPPNQCKIAAIGTSTANAIKQQGIDVQVIAKPENSEGLFDTLKNKIEKNFSDLSIVIASGHGGVKTAEDKIKHEGGTVRRINLYTRKKREIENELKREVELKLKNNQVKAICFTSQTAITFFTQEFGDKGCTHIQVVVASERIKNHAIKSGFKNIINANSASDTALIQALVK